MGRLLTIGFVFLLALTIIGPNAAQAQSRGRIYFYEGNNCSQNLIGSISDTQGGYNLKKYRGWNDEARSAYFENAAALTMYVYDSPSGSHGDDYSKINFYGGSACVGTFEQGLGRPAFYQRYSIQWFRHNGLDGKVSRIEVYR